MEIQLQNGFPRRNVISLTMFRHNFSVNDSSRENSHSYRWLQQHHKLDRQLDQQVSQQLDQQLVSVAMWQANCKDATKGNQQAHSAAMEP
jgi:hypothetical protein